MTSPVESSVPTPTYGTQLTLIAFIRAKSGMSDELGWRSGPLGQSPR
jgi:hypothetical protein